MCARSAVVAPTFFRTGNGRAQRCSGEAVYVLRVTGIRHAGLPRSRVTRFQCRLTSVLEQNHFSFKDIDKLIFLFMPVALRRRGARFQCADVDAVPG
jgi:hypothetical protein